MKLIMTAILACAQVKSSTFVQNRTESLTNSTLSDTVSKCPTCQTSELCAAKFEVYRSHTACMNKSKNATTVELSSEEKQALVALHNKLRALVEPPAANMLMLVWDDELEMLAKRWAERCTTNDRGLFIHDTVRFIPGRFSVGQNIADGFNKFEGAVNAWFREKNSFAPYYGNPGKPIPGNILIAHYTQMAWATTSLVGCAVAVCQDATNFYVCNYAPEGNQLPLNLPYIRGAVRGDKCKTRTEKGLCDCTGKVCENEGTMDPSTCECNCRYKNKTVPPSCSLDCSIPDGVVCGRQDSYMATDCTKSYVNAVCPQLCGICPCAEKTYLAVLCSTNRAGHVLPWFEKQIFDRLYRALKQMLFVYTVVAAIGIQ